MIRVNNNLVFDLAVRTFDDVKQCDDTFSHSK